MTPTTAVRGGSFGNIGVGMDELLRAASRHSRYPTHEDYNLGFRVATPEPATLSLLAVGIGALMLRRRWK